jgi:dihydropteroate synthase
MPEAAPIPSAPTPGAWRGAGFGFTFPRPAIVMGVLNVTPDSFSDGGRFFNPQAAVEQAEQMLAEGAEIIDIGGESTRPNATPVAERDEIARVVPVIRAVRARSDAVLSIDTQKPAVARAALDAGAVIVNDIAANRDSAEMWRLVAERRAGYVAMHMQGTPGTMQQDPGYQDVVAEVKSFFDDRLQRFREAGMTDEQTVLDVGIGFGKTLEHNLQLLGSLRAFTNFRRPQLLGVSRKSLFAKLLGLELDERLAPGIAVAAWAILNGVQILRVHDVAPTVHALRTLEAVTAESGS